MTSATSGGAGSAAPAVRLLASPLLVCCFSEAERRYRVVSGPGSDLRESLIQEKRGEYLQRIREQQQEKRSALRRERQAQLLKASVKDARELQKDQWRMLTDVSPLRRELRYKHQET